MARLWASGFENQETATFGELDVVTGSPTISTSVFRSGAASLRCNPTAATAYFERNVSANDNTNPHYLRAYFRIATAPAGDTLIMLFRDGTGTNQVDIRVNSSRALELWATGNATPAQIGSDSSALALNTWYRVELATDNSGATANVTGYIDGVSFASGALNTSGANVRTDTFRIGVISTSTCDFYFDDCAINDSTGAAETGLPGEGKIVHIRPNAAGDNNGASSGDWDSVNEVSPDGSGTIAVLDANNDILDVNCQTAAEAGIGSTDYIKLIMVGIQSNSQTNNSSSWQVRIKSASGGTTSASATTTHDDTTYKTNGDGAPRNYRLVSYTDPTTGVAWTQTGTNSITNMQIGVQAIDANPDVNVSALWALVEYVEHSYTQAEAAFYEDGTEAGSTVIDSGADSITRDVSSDSNILLRLRLQNNTIAPGDSTDDYQLQYELNDSGIYDNIGTSTPSLNDSYSESNQNTATGLVQDSGFTLWRAGQSFTATGGQLSRVTFYLTKLNSPTGTARAHLYAHTGSFGAGGVATGSALASSDTLFDVSTLSSGGIYSLVDFDFSDRYQLTAGTNYVIILEYTAGTGANEVRLGTDNSSPTHTGNLVRYSTSGGWTALTGSDICFYVYTQYPVVNFASTNLTDGNATTNRLGSGSGSFVAGEISEDGLVDNLSITASNYTELLYALTIESTAVEDGDTLDFRVLRNSATTGMTYTVVPRITVEQGNELMETLSDNFDDNSIDTGKWTNNAGADIVEQNQQLELTTDTTAAYKNITAVDTFDLTGSYAHVEIIDEGNQAQTSFEFYPFQLNLDGDNSLFWLITGGSIIAYKKVATTATNVYSTTFNATTHSRVRIREEAGDTYWDTFDSGTGTWTNRHSEANPIAVTALQPLIMVGTYEDEGATSTAIVDNFNIAPVTGGVKDIIGMGIIPFSR